MEFIKHLKFDKKSLIVIMLAALGVILIVFSSSLTGDTYKENKREEYTEVGFYTSYLEKRITELCNGVNGVSNTTVFLTLDTSSEYIYQNNGVSDFLILTSKDGEQAVKLCEIYPTVRGIAVVCCGGDIPRIQETLTELLSAALGLSSNKIRIAGSS